VAGGGLGAAGQQREVRARLVRRRRRLRPLDRTLDELRETAGIQGNAAFYLSIPPSAFPTVLKQMDRTGMADNDRSGGWRRVVVEKPFGTDLESAKQLNDLVDNVFTAPDVFRIDHYLGKETVQNILALRFANAMFEPVWNSRYIDSVQITMAEDVGIASRAAFYDATGTARDVLQNHLMQLLAMVAMEEPTSFDAAEIRTEKLKVLRAITLPNDVTSHTVRGQYLPGWVAGERAVGYLEEEGVPADSKTETYVAVTLGIQNRRWAGVPFYVRAGKRLPRRVTEIAVLFKKAPHLPFHQTDVEMLGNNQLVIRVQPDEGVTLKFGSKVPGTQMEVRDITMDFQYGEAFTDSSPEAYERLILDVLLGDRTLFPDAAEVEASWRWSTRWRRRGPAPPRAVPGRRVGAAAAERCDGRSPLRASASRTEGECIGLWDTTGARWSSALRRAAQRRRRHQRPRADLVVVWTRTGAGGGGGRHHRAAATRAGCWWWYAPSRRQRAAGRRDRVGGRLGRARPW
jgi:glucose-6-phosphate 1-dehydrogenase